MQYSMVSIDSQGLNDFLADWAHSFMAYQMVWLGGRSVKTWGEWSWADGSTWSYTNWLTGQPNEDFPAEDCVAINYHTDDDKG